MLKIYDEKLKNVKEEITFVIKKLVSLNEMVLKAYEQGEYKIFENVKKELIALENIPSQIDNKIVDILALYTPEARDLRIMVSYLKITSTITRARINTKSFIKEYKKLVQSKIDLKSINKYAIPLHKAAIEAMSKNIEIISKEDKQKTQKYTDEIVILESKTDDLYESAQENILKIISKNQANSQAYFSALKSLRKLEKVADRALNIANLLLFAHAGGEIN